MSKIILICDCGKKLWPSKEDKVFLSIAELEQIAKCSGCAVNYHKVTALIDYTIAVVKAEGIVPSSPAGK